MRKLDKSNMLKLNVLDDLLNDSPTANGMTELYLAQLKSFPQHKFKLYSGERLDDMVESIKQFGVLMPLIVWQKDDEYIILSGHNRANAAQIAGLNKVQVVIKENLTFEEATLIVTETNLRQRSFSDLSESEKALCLAQHYEAMKSQGKRNDLLNEIESLLTSSEIQTKSDNSRNSTSSETQTKLRADSKLAEEYGLSRDKVAKYIRISSLTSELLNLLDSGKVVFGAAYTLSFIENNDFQLAIYRAIENYGFKLDMKKAEILRQKFESGTLNESKIDLILLGELKQKEIKPKAIKLKSELAEKYFTDKKQSEIDSIISRALEFYFANGGDEN